MAYVLDNAQVDHLERVLREDIDRNEEHLDWLQNGEAEASGEEDIEIQVRECEASLIANKTILAVLGRAYVEPQVPGEAQIGPSDSPLEH